MKLRFYLSVLLYAVLIPIVGVSCAPASGKSMKLTSFTERYVAVAIYLEHDPDGNAILSGTFTPSEGHHLYS
ncbi:MAG: hypothetical protein JW730_02460, partial [Anaerolineales bacterium]|nr:hypothetical protein [Anaerolineales bacterium]